MNSDVKNGLLSRRIARDLELAIRSGELAPGSRMPAQRELATRMGVSRTALRDALALLEARGLLRSLPGSGTYVAEPKSEVATGDDEAVQLRKQYSKLDLCRFRLAIEVPCIRLTAMKVTDDDIDHLSASTKNFKDSVRLENFDLAATHDAEFHRFIVMTAGVPLFTDLHAAFQNALVDTIAMLPPIQSRGWEAVVEHERVLEALKRRDPDEAVYYMNSHIIRSAQRLGFVLPTEIL